MSIQKDTLEVIERTARTISDQVSANVSANVSKQIADVKLYVVEEMSKNRERISSLEIKFENQDDKIENMKQNCIATHPPHRRSSSSTIPKPHKPKTSVTDRIKFWAPVSTGVIVGIGSAIKYMIDAGWF